MKRAYAALYDEDSFQGVSVPFQMLNVLEKIMNETDEVFTGVFDNYEEYRDEEVEMSHYAKDGSDGCTDLNSVEEFKKWFFNTWKRRIEANRIPNLILEYIKNLEEITITDTILSDNEAEIILEDIIDTLIEVGNGTTDKQLHEAADKLLNFRDNWFNKVI